MLHLETEAIHFGQNACFIVPHNIETMENYVLSSFVLALENEQWNEYYHLKTSSKRSSSIGP